MYQKPSARLKWYTSSVDTVRWISQEKIWRIMSGTRMGGYRGTGDGRGYGGLPTFLSLSIISGDRIHISRSQVALLKPQRICNDCKTLVLCMLLKMLTFADAKPIETAVRENPSNLHGILRLTHCPPVRLQNQKQPRNSSPMRQNEHITHDISAQSPSKRLIEWE